MLDHVRNQYGELRAKDQQVNAANIASAEPQAAATAAKTTSSGRNATDGEAAKLASVGTTSSGPDPTETETAKVAAIGTAKAQVVFRFKAAKETRPSSKTRTAQKSHQNSTSSAKIGSATRFVQTRLPPPRKSRQDTDPKPSKPEVDQKRRAADPRARKSKADPQPTVLRRRRMPKPGPRTILRGIVNPPPPGTRPMKAPAKASEPEWPKYKPTCKVNFRVYRRAKRSAGQSTNNASTATTSRN
ncbi:hypothetical protein BSKO_05263 [Bryopsis sp. KO-2023]|nr:hypothetical protein BSKO_05263 [Bryopsis sp. KO-2023]